MRYEFGSFRLDTETLVLLRDGAPAAITPKALQILRVLVENSGRVVPKDELLTSVWPGITVEEANLTQNIFALRRLLGETPRDHRFIATVPGRGYQFVAAVRTRAAMDAAHSFSERAAPPPQNESGPLPGRNHWRAARGYTLLAALAVAIALAALSSFLRQRDSPPPFYSAVPLTSYAGSQIAPSFAPDGERVAFAWDGEKQDNFDIYVKQIGVPEPIRLTNDPRPDLSPAWSPDGRSIAFVRDLSDNQAEILLMPSLTGRPVRRLTGIAAEPPSYFSDIRFLAWSPDGKWLVVSDARSSGASRGLFLVSVETGEKRQLTQPPPQYDDLDPAFSADMRRLVFARHSESGTSDLYLLSLSKDSSPQGEPQRLTFYGRRATSPVWTPDGRIVFARSEQVGTHSLWRLPVSNPGNPEPLPIAAERSSTLALSAQRERLVYSREKRDTELWGIELSMSEGKSARGNGPRPWIVSSGEDLTPQFSPNGQQIAFQSTRSGFSEIWLADRDGSNPRQLTDFRAGIEGFPRWSPDGNKIVFHSRQKTDAALFILNIRGGPPTRLTSEPSNDTTPSWSHDGKWIYFMSRRTGDFQIWKVSVKGAPMVQLTKQGGFSPLESIDGQFLFYGKIHEPGLWRLPLSGGEEERILPDVAAFGSAFDVSRRGLYFIGSPRPGAGKQLSFLSFGTGRITPLAAISRPVDIGLGVSPDERLVVYTQLERSSNLMLVENFR